jgi:exodeoxyribonuclease VII large subunit
MLALRMGDGFRNLPPRQVWGVAALMQAAADALAARFSACTVQGELSAFMRAASGHCYFTLKDADGASVLLKCAMFRRAAALLDFPPQDGQRVELRGRLAVYEPRGELQFIVESMQRSGVGSLYERFLRLKAGLEAQGLFDASRKRPIPAFPRSIGVVTSTAAAALHDVLTALERRSPHVRVVVYPSAVQGPDAPAALVRALTEAGRRAEVDTLILCRGGGSLEDLWAFNDERVVRAVVASPIPVICGVGHETDVSLSDLAADLRAPTPTAAAELAAPARLACAEALEGLARRLQRRLHAVLERQQQRLDGATLRLMRPAEAARRRQQSLELLAHRLATAARRPLAAQHATLDRLALRLARATAMQRQRSAQRVDTLQARLGGLDPRRVLSRGFAWLSDDAGRVVHGVSQLSPGDTVRATLADGQLDLHVFDIRPDPLP